ncbi:MAG: hypothetical protein ACOC80_07750 [Petrotogales bacterium]
MHCKNTSAEYVIGNSFTELLFKKRKGILTEIVSTLAEGEKPLLKLLQSYL